MGTWGTGLYSDDTACDVREDYRDHLGEGLSGERATDRVLAEWADQLEDADVGPVFWLALADTQYRCGRLEERVKRRALEVIDSGRDLLRWGDNPADRRRRQRALERLRERLCGPPRSPVRVRKRHRAPRRFGKGRAFGYRLTSGRFAVLSVVAEHQDRGGVYPIVVLLDWIGDGLPSRLRLQLLAVRRSRLPGAGSFFMMAERRPAEYPAERILPLGLSSAHLRLGSEHDATVVHWSDLDGLLEEWFELE